jgi:phenylalanyl-tRNA synthetase beta chain
MKISLNWLKNYIDLSESPEVISKLLTDTGLEVESHEKIEQIEGGLAGLVVGEVLTCEKHPDADKLKITTVDIGEDQPSPIVCGAPNVAVGQKVIVATVGATLYPTEGDSFKIKKAKIRGEVSEGMICAEDEIGIGVSHAGIMILDTELPNGTPAAEYFDLEDDTLIEIGLTPNRADATSHIGVARDLKAVLNREVKWPSVEGFKKDNDALTIEVSVENKEACPRYSGVTLTDVNVGESPEWLKAYLRTIGLAPINNIVDITNFVLHEVGQPLHAFDADKISGNKVLVKTLADRTKFTTLDEKERKLNAHDLMICDGNSKGMCIAGVFGGIESGITATTKNIFLESAYFSPDYVRKTAQSHQLKTDASFRYERGTDPNITIYALKRAALLFKELAGAKISSDVIDIYNNPIKPFEVAVKYKNIDRLIGKNIPRDRVHTILESLDINIEKKSEAGFTAIVPPYRVDVQREADVIEEILRIYGFNNIELPDHVGSSYLADFPATDKDKIQFKIGQTLASRGYFEIITNSLTKPAYAASDGSINEKEDVVILNKLSEDLGVMRQSMLYSLLEVAAHNINRKQADLKIFEFGKTYKLQEGTYKESNRLGILITGNVEAEHWAEKLNKVAFHDLSAVVNVVLGKLTNKTLESKVAHNSPFDYALEYQLNGKPLATLGKVNAAVCRKAGVKQEIFYADLDWNLLLKQANNNIVFEEVSKFPEVRRDLSLVIDKEITFDKIKALATTQERKLLKRINVFDVYEGDKIDSDKKAYAVSFILEDKEKTLTDKVIDKTMAKLMTAFENDLGAIIRK